MASDETRHGADQKAASFLDKLKAHKADILPQVPADDTPPQDPPRQSMTSDGFTIMRNHSANAAKKPKADAPKADAAKAEENIEASIAMALEAMEPADTAPDASAEDKKLDAAIDEIIADDGAAAAQKPAVIMPGSFGAVGETATGTASQAADAAPASNAKETAAAANMIERQAATLIGSTMAKAIKSIVHDEMSQTIDLIARRAVRDAFRQA